MSILITAATTAESYQLKNKLESKDIILGDFMELPELMVKTGKMISLPNPASNSYSHQVLTLCLDRNINTIYPLRKEEQQLLKEAGQLFEEYGIEIVIP
ncbi:MAG: hypothetical protein ACTHNW_08560 [Mucilaginibacter sp.]